MTHARLGARQDSATDTGSRTIANARSKHVTTHRIYRACMMFGKGLDGHRCRLTQPVSAHVLADRSVRRQSLLSHIEPENALSLPTWAVHTSSVFEWGLGMRLMWKYGEISGNPRWKGMAWGMLPCLGSAMCACTWHFFYNATELEFLVALQAVLTIIGNTTCWIAAYRIYTFADQDLPPDSDEDEDDPDNEAPRALASL